MKQTAKRLVFDAVLTVIIVAEMLVQLTGTVLHEILGAIFFATIIAHLVIQRRWIAYTVIPGARSNSLSEKHTGLLVVAILLLADMVFLVFSSIMISTVLFDAGIRFDALYFDGIWYLVHVATSYALCALVIIHVAMHWKMVASVLSVSYDPSRREAIGQGIGAIAALGVIAVGIASSQSRNIQDALTTLNADQQNSADTQPTPTMENKNTNSTSSNGGASSNSSSTSSGSGSSSSSAYDSYSTSSSDDTCPLCPKRCSLSAPKCDKPRQAGLI